MEQSIEKVRKERDQHISLIEEQKRRELKLKEIETKKYLDMQIQAKEANKQLFKVQDNIEASVIYNDVRNFEEQQRNKKEVLDRQMKAHRSSLEKQIGTKGGKVVMAETEFMLNKKLIESIEGKNVQGSPVSTTIKKPF